ncbi:eukaryotic integral membrane protein-domain-containing protein [Radiomyces spectabilis]|uniref:eukaryotic integral membrane protein-domain-containing protein n=1 Tax=Radiomyces spectabilis TaxID=64574 RepID=UPI00221F8020|nr:eukaryotic integral membrane protein-domain-containing protein [Radiomyces spectabilis]KAI8388849.1 eukaryotic integral membrane protein-domain-containing protein [Radiomyces spectabilis]
MTAAQALKASLSNVPSLTKALVTSVVLLSGASYVYIYRQQLNAVPEATIPNICPLIGLVPGMVYYAPWTILTAAFYEDNVFTLILGTVVLLLCGKYLERAWGSRELLKYILLVAALSNIVTWFGIMITYYISGDERFLFNTQINGMSGIFSAFLVAFKHLIPEHRIAFMGGLISIRVKNLLGLATAASIIGLLFFNALVFYNLVNIGWVIGWVYIRFFKYQNGVQGDRSETFAITTFFPEFLHPIIRVISNTVFGILVALRCCKPMARNFAYDLEGQTGVRPGTIPLPGSARAEAERRRALALKALDLRLSNKQSPAHSPAGANSNNSNINSGSGSSLRPTPSDTAQASNADDGVLFDAEEAGAADNVTPEIDGSAEDSVTEKTREKMNE